MITFCFPSGAAALISLAAVAVIGCWAVFEIMHAEVDDLAGRVSARKARRP